jgi:glycosyltransferase involved in cell wall biosynthesis
MWIALLTDGVHPFVIGGMQRHSLMLAKHLARSGVQVDLYRDVPREKASLPDGFTPDERKNVRCIDVAFPESRFPGHYLADSFRYSVRLLRQYRRGRPAEFVYAQGFTGWAFVMAGKRQHLPPIGVNFHGLNMFQPSFDLKSRVSGAWFRPAVSYNLVNADVAFSMGGRLTHILRKQGIPESRICEVPNGVDREWLNHGRLQGRTGATTRFVFLGRYEKLKGIELLQRVAARAPERCEFGFIGPIPPHLRLSLPHVTYHGEIREESRVRELLRGEDVLILPSFSEGMPTVILEAMASGLGIIATDVGACRELVSEANGCLIAPGDERALEQAVARMSAVPDAALLRMKRRSLEQARDHFLWDRVARKTILEIEARTHHAAAAAAASRHGVRLSSRSRRA